jgi:hypothetical protein
MTLTVLIMSRHTPISRWLAQAIASLGHVPPPAWRASEALHVTQVVRVGIAIADIFGLAGRGCTAFAASLRSLSANRSLSFISIVGPASNSMQCEGSNCAATQPLWLVALDSLNWAIEESLCFRAGNLRLSAERPRRQPTVRMCGGHWIRDMESHEDDER